MKVYVFGTGECSEMYSRYVENETLCFLDNNKAKYGKRFHGKEIFSPTNVNYDKVDYVLIFINKYNEVINQLLEIGVNRNKIKTFEDLNEILEKPLEICDGEKKYAAEIWMESEDNKPKVLMLSHELSRTGVPVAVMHMAELFIEMGWDVVIGALCGGTLEAELQKKNLKYISDLPTVACGDFFEKFINSFDFIMNGTIGVAKFVHRLDFYEKLIVWWFNEKYIEAYEEYRLPKHKDNILYFADGKLTIEVFHQFYPERRIKPLYYFLDDAEMEKEGKNEIREYVEFMFAAAMIKRKAPDVLIEAIKLIPERLRAKMKFLFVGKQSNEMTINWAGLRTDIPQIEYMGEVSQDELEQLYCHVDVFVCPSRDDTVPIVVTQAFQHAIPCIISDQVGQSELMKNGYAGFVFKNEDYKQLADYMIWFLRNPEEIKRKGKQGRQIFENNFTKMAIQNVIRTDILPYV